MRNGNPLTGLRIAQNQEGRVVYAQQRINLEKEQRIHINPKKQNNNPQNNIIREENEEEQGDQENQNQNNNDYQMDLI